jgi:hypothetical protein
MACALRLRVDVGVGVGVVVGVGVIPGLVVAERVTISHRRRFEKILKIAPCSI